MSELAEYARDLHEKEAEIFERIIRPVHYPSLVESLNDIHAVIFDVYGTLVNYWKPGFQDKTTRGDKLLSAFRSVADRFGMTPYLAEMNPADPPEKTLSDFYSGLIAIDHEKSMKKGVTFPEIKIENIWAIIIMMLKRRGYSPEQYSPGNPQDFARYCAFTYNFLSLGRQLYPGVVDALAALKKNNIMLGILSNAQFYTPIDLTLFIRDQSNGNYDDYLDLFDPDLIFYSFEYGVAKPNQLLFRRLFDALYELHILPAQTVLVGNDLFIDIKPAQEAGMHTAFFTGDMESAFVGDLGGSIVPDISFEDWSELPGRISFFSGEQR